MKVVIALAGLVSSLTLGVLAGEWAPGESPAEVSARLSRQFLSTDPLRYRPEGYGGEGQFSTRGYGDDYHVHYSVVSLWANGIACARKTGDTALEKDLLDRFASFYGENRFACCTYRHVDYNVFGGLPAEVYLANRDPRALALAVDFAERQWEKPGPKDHQPSYAETKLEVRRDWWSKGYSPQTRLWIDDMYMITFLQTQAYRATGDRKYLDRAAKEMVLYMDRLQLENGLFHHSATAPFAWGRGNGWMAGGLALLLQHLPSDHPHRERLLASYRRMMATLLVHQRASGLWGQLVDDAESWDETSGSAMFAFAFQTGVNGGWLERETYGPAARCAYAALVKKLDARANLADVCEGTNAKNSREWYLKRGRVNGDPHGQAPLMWLCNALLSEVTPVAPAPVLLNVIKPFPSSAKAVTYEMFGAVGDGVADDRAAICAAHEAANARKLPVKVAHGRTYRLGPGKGTAIVRTDVDFGDAVFVIDDRDVESRDAPAFRVEGAPAVPVKNLATIARGAKSLAVRLPADALVVAVSTKTRQFIRHGRNENKGDPLKEIFLVRRNGSVDPKTLPNNDFAEVTSCTAYPREPKRLTLKGGTFRTIANAAESKYTYYNRGIVLRRSNVLIEGLRHEIVGEGAQGAPYAGFLNIAYCSDVTVKDCVFTGHKTYETIGSGKVPVPMGSYDIHVESSANVSLLNCTQTNDIQDKRFWGVFASDYCKNLLFDGCAFARFDAHKGVTDATIRNSRLGHVGIKAIGYGTLTIENTTVSGHAFVNLREDYGSFWDGEIHVKNCTFVPNGGARSVPYLVRGRNRGDHDFGYPRCTMPRRIVFDGLVIDDANGSGGPYVFTDFNDANRGPDYREAFPYGLTEEVVLKNVRTKSGRPVQMSPNEWLFRNVKVVKGK